MIKGAGITSHFFVISNQRRLIIKQSFNEKRKKDFVFLYITPFLRLYTYKSWSESRSLARSEFVRTKEIKQIKSRTGKGISEIFTFFFLYRAFRENKGVLFMADQWIIGPSWIWTSVDILPTNLQSVPINRSGIDPGRINFRLIGNPWSTSFRSTLPPGEVESPLPPWKRDVLNR